jgi:two-component system, response regulator YesN
MFKILIIDDEEIIREGLRSVIDGASFGCILVGEAEDGDEGIEMVGSLKPDIVFTDIRMPGLNGLEMISKIKSLKLECKIIILTGFRDFTYAQEAVRLGAFRFLLKPTKTEELTLAIEDAIKEIKKTNSDQKLFDNLKKKIKEQYVLNEINDVLDDITSNPDGKNSSYLVSKALVFMKANFAKELSLKSVADELYISNWHLSKLLKKETGNTFIDILNEIRIEEAKKLLLQPKYKIYEIAGLSGFSDIPYFTKLFKKHTSLTPMEYKNKAVEK